MGSQAHPLPHGLSSSSLPCSVRFANPQAKIVRHISATSFPENLKLIFKSRKQRKQKPHDSAAGAEGNGLHWDNGD